MNARRALPSATAVIAVSLLLAGCQAFVNAMNASVEANRTVTVVIEGAVFGPTDATGRTWDGRAIPEGYAAEFLHVAAIAYPPGEVVLLADSEGHLARLTDGLFRRFNDRVAPPDALGRASVMERGNAVAEQKLPKRSNTFTPGWGVRLPNVAVHRARVVVTFWDSDTFDEQYMAKVVLTERDLLAVEEAGEVVALDTSSKTGGAVLRLLVSVYGN
jgi:hypothetical protein